MNHHVQRDGRGDRVVVTETRELARDSNILDIIEPYARFTSYNSEPIFLIPRLRKSPTVKLAHPIALVLARVSQDLPLLRLVKCFCLKVRLC